MIVDHVPPKAQLRADLAQGPALGIQLCRTLYVHSATLNELKQTSAFVVEAYGLRRYSRAAQRTGQAKHPAGSSPTQVRHRSIRNGRLARLIALRTVLWPWS